MEKFLTVDSSEKTIAIVLDKWWPQATRHEMYKISQHYMCNVCKQRNESQTVVEGVFITSRSGAPS